MAAIDRARIWIVIGNSSRARLYGARVLRGRWTVLRELEHPASRAKVSALVTDDRGRGRQAGTDGASTALETHVSPKEMQAIRFAAELARILEDGLDRHAYDELLLAVPPRFLGHLRQRLTKHVRRRIVAVLEKDLTALAERELKQRVAA